MHTLLSLYCAHGPVFVREEDVLVAVLVWCVLDFEHLHLRLLRHLRHLVFA